MKRSLVLAALAVSGVFHTHAGLFSFYVRLNGAQETPPNWSSGWGSASALYDSETKEFGLGGFIGALSSEVTGADLHLGIQEVAGPVVMSIPNAPIGFLTGAINVGPVVLTAAEEADLFFGRWYVNIPTLEFPDGEIRGQVTLGGLVVVPEPEHYAILAGVGLVGFAAWRRRLRP